MRVRRGGIYPWDDVCQGYYMTISGMLGRV